MVWRFGNIGRRRTECERIESEGKKDTVEAITIGSNTEVVAEEEERKKLNSSLNVRK